MSALDSLIRVHRWQVDEQRRRVTELDQLGEKLREDLRRLEAEQTNEQAVAQRTPEIAYSYGSYAGALVERRRNLVRSLTDAERQTAAARERLAEIYQEAKRYEIAAARRKLSQRLQANRREQAIMDELAIDIHRRANGRSS